MYKPAATLSAATRDSRSSSNAGVGGVPAKCTELHAPQTENGMCGDLWLGVVAADAGAAGHGLGGHLHEPVRYVALGCAQGVCAVHQTCEPAEHRQPGGMITLPKCF